MSRKVVTAHIECNAHVGCSRRALKLKTFKHNKTCTTLEVGNAVEREKKQKQFKETSLHHLHVSQLVPFGLEGHVDSSQQELLPEHTNSAIRIASLTKIDRTEHMQ